MKTTRYVIQFRDGGQSPWCDDPESRYGPTEDRATAERWLANLRRSIPSRDWRLIARTDEVIEPEPQPESLAALEARIAALESDFASAGAINPLSARVSHLRPKKATRK